MSINQFINFWCGLIWGGWTGGVEGGVWCGGESPSSKESRSREPEDKSHISNIFSPRRIGSKNICPVDRRNFFQKGKILISSRRPVFLQLKNNILSDHWWSHLSS
jgi:hypothetical protein